MAEDDYSGSQGFADEIVDQTLDTLRDQADRQGEEDLHGNETINPQVFLSGDFADSSWNQSLIRTPRYLHDQLKAEFRQNQQKRHLLVGPISFETKFTKLPNMTFGQYGPPIAGDVVASTTVTNYTPFLVQAYVHEWRWVNGVVDGFLLGVYALTSPPPGVTTHTISWRATGEASRYSENSVEDTWSESYDQNDPDFLTEETGETFEDYSDN